MQTTILSDYHLHSIFSDGVLTPEELINLARELKVKKLALTDHDNMDGIAEFFKFAKNANIDAIAGMEVSSVWHFSNIHILAYWQDYENLSQLSLANINNFILEQKNLRMQRAKLIADILNKNEFRVDFAELCAMAQPSVPTRPHFANYLIKKGYFKDFGDVFKTILGKNKIGDINVTWLDMQEVVVKLKKLGAKVALAHPFAYDLSLGARRQLFKDFKQAGGMALEIVNSTQDVARTKALLNYCQEFNFSMVWGSDFHTPSRSQIGLIAQIPKGIQALLD